MAAVRTNDVFTRHLTSSSHFEDLKGKRFGRIIFSPSFIVIAFL